MATLWIGSGFAKARDVLAAVLIRLGVSPSAVTVAAATITGLAGVALALGAGDTFAWSLAAGEGASLWLVVAVALMVMAAACDMLDGAIARQANRMSTFGAFLDSTLDRFSDFAIFVGIAIYYVWSSPANITVLLMCAAGFFNAFMISYTRARAEAIIRSCPVGYWQRGERLAGILIAAAAHNVPAFIAQQAILPAFTVLRRMRYTYRVATGRKVFVDVRAAPWWIKIRLWRWPRGTTAYTIVTAINILWLIFARFQLGDPVRDFVESLAR